MFGLSLGISLYTYPLVQVVELFRVNNVDSNVLPKVYKVPSILLSLHYSFAEAGDTTTDGCTGEVQSYFGVAVGLGVVLAVIVIVHVITVLWLKRRQWVLPCAGDLDL